MTMFVEHDGGRAESKRPRSKGDCTVRALALVTGVTFDEAYDTLATRGRKPHRGADKDWLKKPTDALLGHAFVWTFFPGVKGTPRMNTARFLAAHPTGRYIIRQAGHVAAVIGGALYDTEPSDDRCVYGAWTVTKTAFIDLCELAGCSPDFDVVYRFTDAQAVAWLTARLQRQGHDIRLVEVEQALAEWANRPRGTEHRIAP